MRRKHAIVIGAGAGGVLAARVLASRFESVTLLERDPGPAAEGESRRGVPQSRHVHNLLFRGVEIIEELFPGFFDEGIEPSARPPRVEVAQGQRLLGPFGWSPVYPTGKFLRGFSRPFLDAQLLRRIGQVPNLTLRYGAEIEGLVRSKNSNRIIAVRLRDQGPAGPAQELTADLIVDASGRSSRLVNWLTDLGIGPIQTRKARMGDAYACRTFAYHGTRPDWQQFAILRAPPVRHRGAYLLEVERDRWMVALVGGEGDAPPATEDGFLEFARSLENPTIHRFITNADPEGPIQVFRNMDPVCRYFDKVADWPDGLVALGDSVCTFNPIFGQGMTTAAVGATHLGARLDEPESPGWERAFHRELIDLLASPWLYSVREQIRDEQASGFWKTYRGWVFRTLWRAVPMDPLIHFRLFQVQSLLSPVKSLYDPRLALRALWTLRKSKWTRAATPIPTDVQFSFSKNAPTLRKAV